MADLGLVFLSTFLLAFSASLAVAGLFGAYFGKGRSRALGFLLALVALLLAGLFAALTYPVIPGLHPIFDPEVVGQSMLAVLAGFCGTALAALLFVFAVTRS
jgi:drug/metabolite transporter (DMT)-like permease